MLAASSAERDVEIGELAVADHVVVEDIEAGNAHDALRAAGDRGLAEDDLHHQLREAEGHQDDVDALQAQDRDRHRHRRQHGSDAARHERDPRVELGQLGQQA